MKRLLNPFIWIINYMNYFAHLESQKDSSKYEKYDFTKDIGYYK